jgi:16S rRNA (guanine(527)-N(7))-methyltransferase RsmG
MNISADLFESFVQKNNLTERMAEQFKIYAQELIAWNQNINLTAITDEEDILLYHFQDSLALSSYVDLSTVSSMVDVGTGAGFPGIPLKICYPHMHLVLLEVNHKKIKFLEHIINKLGLKHIETSDLDWRTFLRKTVHKPEFVCARASLAVDELLRMFKPSSSYINGRLIYWASSLWHPAPAQKEYIEAEHPYSLGVRHLKLVFFKHTKKEIHE